MHTYEVRPVAPGVWGIYRQGTDRRVAAVGAKLVADQIAARLNDQRGLVERLDICQELADIERLTEQEVRG